MSKKRTTYSSAFKTKLVLELLQNADTLAEIARVSAFCSSSRTSLVLNAEL